MNRASARNLPDSSCTRRGWRTSRLRSVAWLYSVATAPANRHSATMPMRFETSTTPWTRPSGADGYATVTLNPWPPVPAVIVFVARS